jgi:hypothetical protein
MSTIETLEKPSGKPKNKGGRPKGSSNDPNVVQMRNIMRLAISRVGAADALVKFYRESAENRRAFWGIAGRMLPLEVSGPGGEALEVKLSWIDGREVDKAQVIDVVSRQVAEISHTLDEQSAASLIDIDVAPNRSTD